MDVEDHDVYKALSTPFGRKGVVGWTRYNGDIVVVDHVLQNGLYGFDTFIFNTVAHELVHRKQYNVFWSGFRIGFILARLPFCRRYFEDEAHKFGDGFESWVRKHKGGRPKKKRPTYGVSSPPSSEE